MKCLGHKGHYDELPSTEAGSDRYSVGSTQTRDTQPSFRYPCQLAELRSHIAAKLNVIHRRTGNIARLARNKILIDRATMANILQLDIAQHDIRALEISFMIVNMVSEMNENLDGITDRHCDVAIETMAVTSDTDLCYTQLDQVVMEILTICAIWGVECSTGTNISRICYQLLNNIAAVKINEYLGLYTKRWLKDVATATPDEQVHRLTLLRECLKARLLNDDERKVLTAQCLWITQYTNSIYLDEIIAALLADLWEYGLYRIEEVDLKSRTRLLSNIVSKGRSLDSLLPMLTQYATSDILADRKMAIAAIYKCADSMPHRKEILRYISTCLERIDMDASIHHHELLVLKAAVLPHVDACTKYIHKLVTLIENLLSLPPMSILELALSKETDKLSTLATQEYFALRNILQAAIATIHRASALNCWIDMERNDLMLCTYLPVLCPDLGPYSMALVDELLDLDISRPGPDVNSDAYKPVVYETTKTWIQIVDQCSGTNPDDVMKQVCFKISSKVISHMLRTGCHNTGQSADILTGLLKLINKVTAPIGVGPSYVDISETLAWIATWLSVAPSKDVPQGSEAIVAKCIKRLVKVTFPGVHKTRDSHPLAEPSTEHIRHNCVAGFELLLRTPWSPSIDSVFLWLSMIWDNTVAQTVFNALTRKLESQRTTKQLLHSLVMFATNAKIHTEWNMDTLEAMHQMIYAVLKRWEKEAYGWRITWINHKPVLYTPGLRSQKRRLDTHIPTFLGQLMKQIEFEATRISEALRTPMELLDGDMKVPESIRKPLIDDCPGE
ncbi:hypothetical protein BBOV_II006275 [Babesia bovis T2Bo]|uniref:hypothetical protein n=1 Tax=Babesia bovis T2Bo TaxID=484906 RepID=UPI001C359AD7|nr:hypothetical protein BBOV_II006275 [Babesia bovis T2Bo]KAG6440169.1 hypothetical protein BBOV_II006275 [Babesia bovis T2Bo]